MDTTTRAMIVAGVLLFLVRGSTGSPRAAGDLDPVLPDRAERPTPGGPTLPQAGRATIWATGVEGQRKADLGNGWYLNPIFPGDHPDPSVLKDGSDYYHAYENGFYNLGRQTLLEPIEWTEDGWFRALDDPARPIRKPAGESVPHGLRLSDDFSTSKMGVQWSFYGGGEADRQRYRYENKALVLGTKGTTPADSSPLWFVCGDHAYEIEVAIDIDAGATAGLLVFYSRRLYAGLGYSANNLILHRYGTERLLAAPAQPGSGLRVRLVNDRHIVTMYYSRDGRAWERFGTRIDVSAYHHNAAGDFLSLRPAIYAAGRGEVRFRDFTYRALDSR